MKRTVRIKLLPSEDQAAALAETLVLTNIAANAVSEFSFEQSLRGRPLRSAVYYSVKALGLSAQPAQHAIKKVDDAYTTLCANLRAGNYGKRGSKRREAVESKPLRFRIDAAQPYDDRCLSWQYDAQTVSIWTVAGRLKNLAYTGRPADLSDLREFRKGESDLLYEDGQWYLCAVIDEPTPAVSDPDGFLGVDLGIVNVATTSDADNWSGGAVTSRRKKNLALRAKLQKKGTKSAKRLLKKRRRKESRFVRDHNHRVSKQIVGTALRTGRGIALEDLTGIRERVRLRKPQRSQLHSWAFAQLATFVSYKAERSGVQVEFVDPAYTSQRCSECGHTAKNNRPDQETFACRSCGVSLNADHNAARNIAQLGLSQWSLRGGSATASGASDCKPAPLGAGS
jgi:IS605 OrfB family transposase